MRPALVAVLACAALAGAAVAAQSAPRQPQVLQAQRRGVTAVRFAPDGRWLAAAGLDGTIRRWEAASGRPLPTLSTGMAEVYDLAVAPSGALLAAAGDGPGVVVVDLRSGAVARRWSGLPQWCYGVAFSPDGSQLAAGCADGSTRVWQARTGAQVARLRASAASRTVQAVAWSPGGRLLATAVGTITLWDTRTWTIARSLAGHDGTVRTIAWSPDGRHLASAALDRSVRTWDVEHGTAERVLRPVGIAVRRDTGWVSEPASVPQLAVAYSRDGRLASAGSDRVVRLWGATGDSAETVLRAHEMSVLTLAFSPDGGTLASAGLDGTVRLWQVPPPPR